ncbi:MAG: hypothetical protein IPO99_14240 [Nitrospira sp.]|nr:hypothetical protein [Nitrospira sp.]
MSLSDKDSQHRENGTVQTFTREVDGAPVYENKIAEIRQQSAKVWFHELWGQDEHVWIEWQVRKALLKGFSIRTFVDLRSGKGLAAF